MASACSTASAAPKAEKSSRHGGASHVHAVSAVSHSCAETGADADGRSTAECASTSVAGRMVYVRLFTP